MTEETGGQPIPSPPFFQSRIWEHGGGPASHLSLSLSHTHSNQPASRSEEGPDQNLFEYVCVHAQSFNRVRLFATPWTVAHQAPLSVCLTVNKCFCFISDIRPCSQLGTWGLCIPRRSCQRLLNLWFALFFSFILPQKKNKISFRNVGRRQCIFNTMGKIMVT